VAVESALPAGFVCATVNEMKVPGSLAVALLFWFTGTAADLFQEVRPGVWAGRDTSSLPLADSGYQVYLLGEMHGVREIEAIFGQYMARLHASAGLRDVAIEEDAAYERDAEAYVEGKSNTIREELCLRAGILKTIRRFNEGRPADGMIRVHLVDIDSPADSIREHLLALKQQVAGAASVRVPSLAAIKADGLKTVDELKRLTANAQILRELRTIQHSIRAYQEGLEVGTGPPKGSPYLEDREQAIASNIEDLLRNPGVPALLALYGSDHVSRSRRKDGGAKRDREFSPVALRLEQAGLRVFSLVTFPLSGRYYWRGRGSETLWTAKDGALANGESLDRLLASAHEPKLLYIDRKRERVKLPSEDLSGFSVDAYLLIASATPMENYCAGVK
jgi:hypothetical protein